MVTQSVPSVHTSGPYYCQLLLFNYSLNVPAPYLISHIRIRTSGNIVMAIAHVCRMMSSRVLERLAHCAAL